MGNFDQYRGMEIQASDRLSVQNPVEDTSSAASLAGFAQGMASTVGSAFELYGAKKRSDKVEQKALLEQQEKEFDNRYDYAIEKMSYAMDSGEMDSIQAKTFLRKVKQELVSMGASADKLNDLESKSLKTLSGRVLLEGTEEERAEKQAEKLYLGSKEFNPYYTEEEKKMAMNRLFKNMNEEAVWAHQKAEYDSIISKADKNSAEYKDAQLGLKRDAIDRLNNMLANSPSDIGNKQAAINQKYESDVEEVGEAQARLNAESSWRAYKNAATRNAQLAVNEVEGGLPVQKKAYLEMLERQEGFLEQLGDSQFVEMQKQLQDKEKTKLNIAIYNSSENIQKAEAMKEIFGGPESLVYFQSLTQDAAKDLNNFNMEFLKRSDGAPISGFGEDRESADASTKSLKSNVSDYLSGDYEGDPKELDKIVSGNLAKLSEDFKTLSTKEIDETLKYYASPEFGEYVKQRKLSGEDIDNINRQMHAYKYRVAKATSNFLRDNLSIAERTKGLGQLASAHAKVLKHQGTTSDAFELVFEGGQVMVKPDNERGLGLAEELNSKISGPLSRILKVDANLSGESKESLFEVWRSQLWPSKYGEQQEETVATDYSQYEGQEMEDEEGNRFIIRNGVPVESGGSSNAANR